MSSCSPVVVSLLSLSLFLAGPLTFGEVRAAADDQPPRFQAKLLHRINNAGVCRNVTFTADSTMVVAAIGTSIQAWDVTSGYTAGFFGGHHAFSTAVMFSRDGKLIASTGYDRTIRLWDGDTGVTKATIIAHKQPVYCVAISPDGNLVASGSRDKLISIWETDAIKKRTFLIGHASRVNSVAFSPDGLTLVSSSHDKTVKLWDLKNRVPLVTLRSPEDSVIHSAIFSPDGSLIASAGVGGKITLWNVKTRSVQKTLAGHSGETTCLAFSPDGELLASGGKGPEKVIKIWRLESGQEVVALPIQTDWVRGIAISPDGKSLAAAGQDGSITVWDLRPDKPQTKLSPNTTLFSQLPTTMPTKVIDVSEDGEYLFAAHQDNNKVTIWNIASHRLVKTLDAPAPRCLLHRDGRLFVGSFSEPNIYVFSQKDDWELKDQLKIGLNRLVHLSAPRRKFFNRVLIADCRKGELLTGKYFESFTVDVNRDRYWKAYGRAINNVDARGRFVATQGHYQYLSPNTVTGVDWANLLASKPVSLGNSGDKTYLVSGYHGRYWLGNRSVWGGMPPQRYLQDEQRWMIPDVNKKAVYGLGGGELRAWSLQRGLPRIEGHRQLALPDTFLGDNIYCEKLEFRFYLPVAVTKGDRLFLYLLDPESNKVFHAEVAAFGEQLIAVASTDTPTAPLQEGVVARVTANQPLSISLRPEQGKFTLLTAPHGATLTAQGELRWTPKAEQVGLREVKARVVLKGKTLIERYLIEVIEEKLYSDSPQFDSIPLDQQQYGLSWSNDRESMLLRQNRKLDILTPDGSRIFRSFHQLPPDCIEIADRVGYYVALGPNNLYLLDKKELRIIKTIDLPMFQYARGMALDPVRKVTYVTGKLFNAGRREKSPDAGRVARVDEESGEARSLAGVRGNWLAVGPRGQFLQTVISYQWDRPVVSPKDSPVRLMGRTQLVWENSLVRHRISGDRIVLEQMISHESRNGQGMVLSPDGAHVSFLNTQGFPPGSHNAAAFSTDNLRENPLIYPTGGVANCSQMAYHGVLDLVAFASDDRAVFFDRVTGKISPNRLLMAKDQFRGLTVHKVVFSVDGRHLIFTLSAPRLGWFLRSVPLRLTDDEQERNAAGLPLAMLTPDDAQPTPVVVVPPVVRAIRSRPYPLAAMETLQGGSGRKMDAQEIAQAYMDSVVVIRSDEGSGTGFIVGSDGYVLTCAHCLPRRGETRVSYRVRGGNDETTTKRVVAQILRVDFERDMALLKIETQKPLQPLLLVPHDNTQAGERVNVIGNPGLGSTTLDYTITEGLVSSPRRALNGQIFIQTSAAVNPGSSGGPMFNSQGFVIGLVALKGQIEGVGFAIPSSDLTAFIVGGATTTGDERALRRQWADSTDGDLTDATFDGFEDGTVTLRSKDGEKLSIKLARLAAYDRRLIELIDSANQAQP